MNRISKQILQSSQFFPKILVGTLLLYTLLGIPFYVGYAARYLHQRKERGTDTLPQWNNWLALLIESWELLLVTIVYGVLPMGIAAFVSSAIDQWFGNLLWVPLWFIPWIPTMFIFLLCPILVGLAYSQYLKKSNLESVLDFKAMLSDFRKSGEELTMITLLFWGAMFIGFPVIGFTLAIAFLLYLALVIEIVENNRYR